MKIRGNTLLKKIDRYAGIPLVFTASLFRRKKKLPAEIKKVGILLTPAIGDTIVFQALLRDIKLLSPETKIILFAPHAVFETACLIKYSDEVVLTNITNIINAIQVIRKRKPDLLIDAGQWTKLSALICCFSKAGHTRGFKSGGQYRHFAFDSIVEHDSSVHEVNNFRRLFWKGDKETGLLPEIKTSKNIEIIKNRVVIHLKPGGANPHLKEWPLENWRKLASILLADGYEICFTGSPADRAAIEEFTATLPAGQIFNAAGKLNISETAELLKSANLVISVNTGIMHLASALGCNLVALHGPTNHKRWGPLNHNSISIQSSYHQAPCLNLGFEYACSDKTGECMKAISLQQVIEAVANYIEIKK